MAVELATAWVSVVPSMAGAERTIQKELGGIPMGGPGKALGTSLGSRMGSAIKNTIGDTFNAVKGIAATTFAGIGTVLAANLGGAIQDADLINNFPKVMRSLGYDAGEAAVQIRRIGDSLDGLPTATSSIVSLVQGFAPMTDSLKEATDLSLALNNAVLAGGASQELQNNALEQYRQMLTAGKPDMMAWRSMMSAMPGQLDQLSKSLLGAESNSMDLYGAMQAGTVSFEDFNDAILDLNENGLEGFESFEEAARNATGGIGTAVRNAGNRIKRSMRTVIEAIGVEAISGRINEFTSQFAGIGESIAGVITQFKDGTIEVGEMGKGLGPIIGLIVGLASKLMAYLPVIGRFLPVISGPVGFIIGLFVQMWINSEKLREAVGNLFDRLSESGGKLWPVLRKLGEWLGDVATVAGDLLAVGLDKFGDTLESIAEWAGELWEQFKADGGPEAAAEMFTDLKDAVVAFWDATQAIWTYGAQEIDNFWEAIGGGETVMPWLSETLTNLTDIVGGFLEILSGLFTIIEGLFTGDWETIWEGVKTVFSGAWSVIEGVFNQVVNNVLAAFAGFGKDIRGEVDRAWEFVKQRFAEGRDNIETTLRNIPTTISNVFTGARDWLVEAGKDILRGLADGIDAAKGWVREKIEEVGESIPGWIKTPLGISSPSKVMRDEIGQWILPGVALGVDDTEDDFRRTLESALNVSDIRAQAPSIAAGPFAALAAGVGSSGNDSGLTAEFSDAQLELLARMVIGAAQKIARGEVLDSQWRDLVSASNVPGVE